MATYTTNYNLDKYEGTDSPNLTDQYNSAMDKIDAQMMTNAQSAQTAQTSASNALSAAQQASSSADAASLKADTVAEDVEGVQNSVSSLETTVSGLTTQMNGKAPNAHASSQTTYGVGSSGLYGHVRLTDTPNSGQTAASGIAATPALVAQALATSGAGGKMLCIGDSYARMEDSSVTSWCSYLNQMLGFDEYNTYAEGGAGFVTAGMSGNNFLNLANNAISQITDKQNYRLVIIAGGRNDAASSSYTSVYSAANSILVALKQAFTNARIIVVPLLWDNVRSYAFGNYTIASAVLDAAAVNGCEGVNWAWTWGLGLDDCYDGGIHPNNAGGQLIASYIASAYRGTYSGRTACVTTLPFGSGDCRIIGSGGTLSILIGGTYSGSSQNATLPDEFTFKNMNAWGVLYAGGGTDTCVLQLTNTIGIYGGTNHDNIGGVCTYPW